MGTGVSGTPSGPPCERWVGWENGLEGQRIYSWPSPCPVPLSLQLTLVCLHMGCAPPASGQVGSSHPKHAQDYLLNTNMERGAP